MAVATYPTPKMNNDGCRGCPLTPLLGSSTSSSVDRNAAAILLVLLLLLLLLILPLAPNVAAAVVVFLVAPLVAGVSHPVRAAVAARGVGGDRDGDGDDARDARMMLEQIVPVVGDDKLPLAIAPPSPAAHLTDGGDATVHAVSKELPAPKLCNGVHRSKTYAAVFILARARLCTAVTAAVRCCVMHMWCEV